MIFMTDRLKSFRDYLAKSKDIPSGDKKYIMDFCKKEEYLEGLRASAASTMHCRIVTGYGNVNSGVCFIFPDEDKFNIIKSSIQEKLEKLNVNFWNLYVTFIKKTDKPFPNQYNYLMNEINAIKPRIIYIFDNDDSAITKIIDEFSKFGKTIERKQFRFIDIKSLVTEENAPSIWKELLYIPGYAFVNDYYEKEEKKDGTDNATAGPTGSTG